MVYIGVFVRLNAAALLVGKGELSVLYGNGQRTVMLFSVFVKLYGYCGGLFGIDFGYRLSHIGSGTLLCLLGGLFRKLFGKATWITHDIIPLIRKTGCYMTDSVLERIRKDPTFTYTLAKAMLREKDRADALEAELNTAKPKADYYDAFVNPYDCTNIRTTAKELKIPERIFVRFLLAEGYMFRSPSNQLLPYNKKSNEGLFIVRDFVNHRFTGSQTYFTPKGKEVVCLHYMRLYGGELPSGLAG